MNGWMGKILRVDLSRGQTSSLDTANYVPSFLGGYGLALKLIWDETAGKPMPKELAPEAPLVMASGPLSGTPSISGGRCEVAGIAPQSYPVPWVADSGFGGSFASKMKYAGYDAIAIVGKAATPVYICVSETVKIKDATQIWGLDTKKTQQALVQIEGDDVAVATIGPAGENLVRLAVIATKTENAAGQDGCGAVMGSKNLKAVVVNGTQGVGVANADLLLQEVRKIADEMPTGNVSYGGPGGGVDTTNIFPEPDGRYLMKKHSGCIACGECGMAFQHYYEGVQERFIGTGTISGDMHCVGGCAPFLLDGAWGDEEKSLEFCQYLEALGLNHKEIFAGMDWFIQNCYNDGKMTELMGQKLNLNPNGPQVYPKGQNFAGFPEDLAANFVRAIAYKEGDGAVWAEGTPRAADALGLTNEAWKTHKHGYGPHWDGRYLHLVNYPLWVISALVWAMWGRDPHNSTHCSVQNYYNAVQEWGGGPIPYSQLKGIGKAIYGTENAFAGWPNDSELGYIDKEIVVIWHQHSSFVKNSLPMCDQAFPLTWSTSTTDNVGDYSACVRLFNAVTGQLVLQRGFIE